MRTKESNDGLEEVEIQLLLEGLHRYYGYDFRQYEPGAVRLRIRESMLAGRLATISRFQEKMLHDPAFLDRFLRTFSGGGLTMFSDGGFFWAFRSKIVPLLKTYPFVRIWHAGCSTGEEVYSIAILLEEEGIYQRCRIYATDMSGEAVKEARRGSLAAARFDEYEANYSESGGKRSLSDYCARRGNRMLVDPELRSQIVLSEHNLATDGSINEFQVIVCRNLLNSFNQSLKERVDGLIYDSLSRFGVLVLGANESLKAMPHEACYAVLDEASGVYQKIVTRVLSRACQQ